ncbi:MAG TPA: gamma-glutamyltransferase family protein [Polyangiaceae bacterium]|nr:gamma-glutamyltransferase family protein [Polyangiaceae bacterium]
MGHELNPVRVRARRWLSYRAALELGFGRALAFSAAFALACNTPRPAEVAQQPAPEAASTSSAASAETRLAAALGTEAATLGAVAIGQHGAVSSAEANASAVGRAVLQRGGNAVDAAVAVAFVLGVTQPSAGNIGGGGFMLVREPSGKSVAIDYREVAPRGATRDMFVDASGSVTSDGRYGPLAAGVPGTVAGLGYAHRRWGSLPWSELLAPAIALARAGHTLDRAHAEELAWGLGTLREYQTRLAAEHPANGTPPAPSHTALERAVERTGELWSGAGGAPLAEGALWQQPELADTLTSIADGGPNAFYGGPLAERLTRQMQAMGGLWTLDDLAAYRVIERAPIEFDYHGHHIITMPPPSGGGVVLRQILAASDKLELASLDWDSAEHAHLFVEIARRAYADRNQLVADPDFAQVPLARLLDTEHVLSRMADIDRQHATPSSRIAGGTAIAESNHTTHFSVVDAGGMAVANTFTLNESFGARVQVPGTGVTLNNEMDDFTAKVGSPNLFGLVQGPQNAIAPGKRMLSSMSPTLVLQGDHLRAVLGSPGGPTITTTVAQVLLQLVDHGRSLEAAIAAPRIHHQWLPDEIAYEQRLPTATVRALRQLGHTLVSEPGIGHANCIALDPETGLLHAVADVTRGGGAAAAY